MVTRSDSSYLTESSLLLNGLSYIFYCRSSKIVEFQIKYAQITLMLEFCINT